MGAVKDALRKDLATAMKARDDFAKSTIRMAISAIGYAEVAGDQAVELSDAQELQVITKERHKRLESAQAYAEGGRQDLADNENREAQFLARYLPQPLTDDELAAIIDEQLAIVEAGLGAKASMRDMGKIVKAVKDASQGRADGKKIAEQVKAKLS